MLLVKIDKSTIKKNPRAGETSTTVLGATTISFVIIGPLPAEFKRPDVFIITSWIDDEHYEGILTNHDLFEYFTKIPGNIQWSVNNQYINYTHFPEPSHFYMYENPLIECTECKIQIHLKDAVQYDDEGRLVMICTNCKSTEPFGQIEYENISSAINEIENSL